MKHFSPAAQLGDMHAASFATDPKHLGFVLARYKFVAKMLTGRGHVLEVGCGDTTGARLVGSMVRELVGIDKDLRSDPCIPVFLHDMRDGAFLRPSPSFLKSGDAFVLENDGRWDGIYALDVLEHVPPADEDRFLDNVVASLTSDGAVIIGMPSQESQVHASELSRAYHVNCKTEDGLRATLQRHFRNVFLFGMNDETLHTGFGAMAHYRLALCSGPR